jgi:hypothetical protein
MDGQIPLILIGLYTLTLINIVYLAAVTLTLLKLNFARKISEILKRWVFCTSILSILIVIASLETIIPDTFIWKASIFVAFLVFGIIWGVSKGYLNADKE